MKQISDIHVDITNEVKEIISSHKIVFPAYYGEIYTQVANSKDIHLKPEELVNREMLDEKMVRHIITLSECTGEAISAMENEDKALLNTVLIKSKKLQDEINELQKIIYEDALTKSYNRKWFEDKLLDNDKLHFRGDGAIVMIDINKFKQINDTYGHNVGDKVLTRVAEKLRQADENVVRYGGDEFILIFDNTLTHKQIEDKLEALLVYFHKVNFKVADKEFKVDFSYGIASFTNGAKVEEITEEADRFMYIYKRASRE